MRRPKRVRHHALPGNLGNDRCCNHAPRFAPPVAAVDSATVDWTNESSLTTSHRPDGHSATRSEALIAAATLPVPTRSVWVSAAPVAENTVWKTRHAVIPALRSDDTAPLTG